MATIEDITTDVTDLIILSTENNATVASVASVVGNLVIKVDEIQAFINTLKGSVPQEKIDALAALIQTAKGLGSSAKDSLADVKTRTEAALADLDSSDD